MSGALSRFSRAVAPEEIEAAIVAVASDRDALSHLHALALDLYEAKCGQAAALTLRLFGDAARRAGLGNERHFADRALAQYLAVVAYTDGDVDALDAALETAATSLAKIGDVRDVLEARESGVHLLLQIGAPARAFEHAIAAAGAVERSTDRDPLFLINLHMLGRLVYERVVGRSTVDAAELFAREAAIFDGAGEREMAICASARLACAHVAAGRAERGLATLEPLIRALGGLRAVVGTSIEKATVENLRPVDEWFAALYWSGRALEMTGRTADAERRYREHPWFKGSAPTEQAEIVLRLAILLADAERYQESLDLLQRIASSGSESVHGAVALALRARIASILETADGAQLVIAAKSALDAATPAAVTTPFAGWRPGRPVPGRDEPPPPVDLLPLGRLSLADARLALDPSAAEAILGETEGDYGAGAIVEAVRRRVRGDALTALGRLDEAQVELEASLEAHVAPDVSDQHHLPMIAERTRRESRLQHGVGADVSLRLARIARLRGSDPSAHLDRGLEIAQQQNRLHLLFDALLERAALVETSGGDSTPDLERATDVIEAIRTDLRDLELQLGALAGKDEVYGRLLARAQARGNAEDALRILERCKARALLDARSAAAAARDRSSSGEASVLRRRIVSEMRRQIAEGVNDDDRRRLAAWKSRLAAIQRQQVMAARVSGRAAATPEEVLALTDEKTALLHLFCDGSGTTMVLARAGRAMPPRHIREASAPRIAALVEAFRFEIATLSAARSLEELAMLLAPLAADLDGVERLLVLPHGPLHAVPFHALPFNGAPLLSRMAVCYSSSASIAAACGAALRRTPRPSAAAVFGTADTPYLPLRRLPNAEKEIEEIAGSDGDIRVFAGEQANRRSLFSLAGELDFLHFACHGEFDDVDPLASRLYLATGPVYGYELFQLQARPRVVVLSACETAVHSRRAGDELFGLSRAFLATGAGAIVASAWTVPDAEARLLVRAFHAQRRTVADPASALRHAQLEVMSSAPHPYYWAAWSVIGGLGEAP